MRKVLESDNKKGNREYNVEYSSLFSIFVFANLEIQN